MKPMSRLLVFWVICCLLSSAFPIVVHSQASCATAFNLTPSTNCSSGNIKNAANASPTGACGGATSTTTYSNWYKFTSTGTTATITVSGLGSSLTATTTYVELLTGTCGSFTSICQNVASPLNATGLTGGTDYYVRIFVTTNPNSGGNPNQYDYTICIVIPPANDDCAGAVNLSAGSSCSNTSGSLNLSTATTGLPVGCEPGGTHYDVWYKFTAASTYEIISISSLGSNITNPAIQLYSGTCGSLTSLQCGTTSITATGLTIGNTYYVRVSNVGSNPSGSNSGFSICVYHPTGATIDYGKSYVNITKGTGGGTINPGDTLEIRATLVIRNSGSTLDSVAFLDTVHTNSKVKLIPGSIALRTNEGKLYKSYTDAFDSDEGYRYISGTDTVIRINMGSGASNVARGRYTNTSRPSVFGSTCIVMATYRVIVTGNYDDTLNLGGGAFTVKDAATTISSVLSFANRQAVIYSSPGLCPGPVAATNAIGGDFNGTFGTPSGSPPFTRNRGTSTNVPSYIYKPFNSSGGPNDYFYGIANNTSSNYTTINTWPKPDSRRVFNVWDIIGDHTGATNPSKGNPPCDTTQAVSATNPCGYMLIINSAYKTDTAFQYTVTNLCPNTYYEISGWFRNICYKCGCDSLGRGASAVGYIPFAPGDSSGVQPNIAFDINGVDYYSTGNIPYTGVVATQQGSDSVNQWLKRGFTYKTGLSQTSLTLTIRNNAPGGGGNDWALDDISLATCLPDMKYSPSLSPIICQNNAITIYDTIQSYFDNYVHYKWQYSSDGGSNWSDISGTTGVGSPSWNGSAWEYITSYTIPPAYTTLANNGDQYRVIVATTVSNLSDPSCQFTDGISIITVSVIDCSPPLTTDLLVFNGKIKEGKAILAWITSKEETPLTYIIERSNDQNHFTAVGVVNSNNISLSEKNYYTFIDPVHINGKVWYRIAMTEDGNKKKYSRIIQLNNEMATFSLDNIVNPFVGELTFDITSNRNKKVEIELIDLVGKTIRRMSYQVYAGANSVSLDYTGNLSPGIYTLRISDKENNIITRKVIKRH